MKKKIFLFIVIATFLANSCYIGAQVKIIFDTDIGGDADDLGALVMLHNLVERGECELLAVMSWSTEKYAVPAIDAINRYYGHPEIPIAQRKDEINYIEWNYNKVLADSFYFALDHNDVPGTTALYRKILSRQENQSVVLVTVGPLLNIKRLLESGPDEFSPLRGKKLVSEKVKQTVIMGGKFPSGKNEWNFNGNMPGVTKKVLDQLPGPVVFSGFEIGVRIKTGEVFKDIKDKHPLKVGFYHFCKNSPWMKEHFKGQIFDNSTYDQTAVLYAVRNETGRFWEKVEGGYCEVDENGDNRWVDGEKTNQSYLRLIADPEEVASEIEAIMLGEF